MKHVTSDTFYLYADITSIMGTHFNVGYYADIRVPRFR
jgi:hypothetical protein